MEELWVCFLGLLGLAVFAAVCLALYSILGIWSAPVIALLAAVVVFLDGGCGVTCAFLEGGVS